MSLAQYRLRDEATYNVLLPGIPELSGIRERLNSCTEMTIPVSMPARRIAVALPLYIYPTEESWKPLYEVIQKHENVDFYTIINPANGPGSIRPDFNYVAQVDKLNSYTNVKVFGYVHVSWANRNLNLVLKDIITWSKWAQHTGCDINIDGVFVDEAPAQLEKLQYMRDVFEHIKKTMSGEAIVWTNPGVELDAAFYEVADLVNSHENTYEAWQALEKRVVNEKSTIMIHSYPGSADQLNDVVGDISRLGYGVALITTSNCYVSFSALLEEFVQTLDR